MLLYVPFVDKRASGILWTSVGFWNKKYIERKTIGYVSIVLNDRNSTDNQILLQKLQVRYSDLC